MTRKDIEKEIEYYKKMIIDDPEGITLYKTLIRELRKLLKQRNIN